jgi:hypothetical protein
MVAQDVVFIDVSFLFIVHRLMEESEQLLLYSHVVRPT